MEEVADYLENEVMRTISKGVSPVKGEGNFQRLDAKYAKNFKGGSRTSNLELEGDLKDSLIVKPATGSFIKFGHEGAQVPKADGHNQISSKAKRWAVGAEMPKRRYIPDDGQKFKDNITSEIKKIIKDFSQVENNTVSIDEDNLDALLSSTSIKEVASPEQRESGTSFVSIDDLFSDDSIDALLEDALRRRP
jgi:phage gpG-like protein